MTLRNAVSCLSVCMSWAANRVTPFFRFPNCFVHLYFDILRHIISRQFFFSFRVFAGKLLRENSLSYNFFIFGFAWNIVPLCNIPAYYRLDYGDFSRYYVYRRQTTNFHTFENPNTSFSPTLGFRVCFFFLFVFFIQTCENMNYKMYFSFIKFKMIAFF